MPNPKSTTIANKEIILSILIKNSHVQAIPAKNVVVHAGSAANTLYYIVKGSVEVTVENDQGNEIVLTYLNEGQFFGEMGLFSTDPNPCRTALVKTRRNCEIAEISYERFRQLIEKYPELLFELAAQIATRLERSNDKITDLAFLDATGRIARAIVALCEDPDAMTHPEGMQIRVSRQELARIASCSREMAGRIVAFLQEKGFLRAHGKTMVVFGKRASDVTTKRLPGPSAEVATAANW